MTCIIVMTFTVYFILYYYRYRYRYLLRAYDYYYMHMVHGHMDGTQVVWNMDFFFSGTTTKGFRDRRLKDHAAIPVVVLRNAFFIQRALSPCNAFIDHKNIMINKQ